MMMKKSASATGRGAWSTRHARKARSEVRCSGFEVPKTSKFGPRTVVRLARPASLAQLSCGNILLLCHTCEPSTFWSAYI